MKRLQRRGVGSKAHDKTQITDHKYPFTWMDGWMDVPVIQQQLQRPLSSQRGNHRRRRPATTACSSHRPDPPELSVNAPPCPDATPCVSSAVDPQFDFIEHWIESVQFVSRLRIALKVRKWMKILCPAFRSSASSWMCDPAADAPSSRVKTPTAS